MTREGDQMDRILHGDDHVVVVFIAGVVRLDTLHHRVHESEDGADGHGVDLSGVAREATAWQRDAIVEQTHWGSHSTGRIIDEQVKSVATVEARGD